MRVQAPGKHFGLLIAFGVLVYHILAPNQRCSEKKKKTNMAAEPVAQLSIEQPPKALDRPLVSLYDFLIAGWDQATDRPIISSGSSFLCGSVPVFRGDRGNHGHSGGGGGLEATVRLAFARC